MEDYVITNGKMFIWTSNNKLAPTTNIELADHFGSIKIAKNVFNNQLSPAYRKTYYVCKVSDVGKRKPTKEKKISDLQKNYDKKYRFPYDSPHVDKWLDRIKALDNIFEDANKREKSLRNELEDLNYATEAINHHIEGYKLNACQMCKRDKILQYYRKKRRAIKDELRIVEAIQRAHGANHIIDDMLKEIDSICHQEYRPKVLSELFEKDGVDRLYDELFRKEM